MTSQSWCHQIAMLPVRNGCPQCADYVCGRKAIMSGGDPSSTRSCRGQQRLLYKALTALRAAFATSRVRAGCPQGIELFLELDFQPPLDGFVVHALTHRIGKAGLIQRDTAFRIVVVLISLAVSQLLHQP